MKKISKLVSLFICVSIISSIITVSVSNVSAVSLVNVDVVGTYNYDCAYDVLDIVNAERTTRGLNPLHMNYELLEAAMQRAAEISISFSHTRPNGETCFSVCTWEKSIGENIAGGYETPADAMAAWRDSNGHYANITSTKYTCVGIGVFTSPDGVIYWSQIFDASKDYEDPMFAGIDDVTPTVSVKSSMLHLSSVLSDTIIDGSKGETSSNISVLHTDPVFPVNINLSSECLNFSSSDDSIVSVDENGVLTAHANGAVDITASLKDDPSICTTTTLTVINTVASIVLPATMTLGDADDDGSITIMDATLVQKWLSVMIDDKDINLIASDVDHDDDVSILDSTLIQKSCANIITLV